MTVPGVVVAEVRKITTTRLWWIMALATLVLSAGYAALPAVTEIITSEGATPFREPAAVWGVYTGGNTLARVLALVLGVTAMGTEYRYRTIISTYLATPRRVRVITAKVLALVLFSAAYGIISVIAGIGTAIPFLVHYDAAFFLDQTATWRTLGLGAFSMVLWALIGLGIGVLVRSTVLAIVIGIGFAYLVEPSVSAVLFIQEWWVPLNLLPSGATNSMLGLDNPALLAASDPWPWWAGLLILLCWSTIPAALGIATTIRRDVS